MQKLNRRKIPPVCIFYFIVSLVDNYNLIQETVVSMLAESRSLNNIPVFSQAVNCSLVVTVAGGPFLKP